MEKPIQVMAIVLAVFGGLLAGLVTGTPVPLIAGILVIAFGVMFAIAKPEKWWIDLVVWSVLGLFGAFLGYAPYASKDGVILENVPQYITDRYFIIIPIAAAIRVGVADLLESAVRWRAGLLLAPLGLALILSLSLGATGLGAATLVWGIPMVLAFGGAAVLPWVKSQ